MREEVLVGLIEGVRFRLLAPAGQGVLVRDHLEMLEPHLPRFLRNVVVDLLAELVVERAVLQPGKLLLKLHALHHPRHVTTSTGRGCITGSGAACHSTARALWRRAGARSSSRRRA